MSMNDPKCPCCGRSMLVPVYRDYFNNTWIACCKCNECDAKWKTGDFIGETKEEAAEKAIAAARLRPQNERIRQLEYALCLMVNQYCSEDDYVTHLHMMAGEHAFAALGIENWCSVKVIEEMLDRMEGEQRNEHPAQGKDSHE